MKNLRHKLVFKDLASIQEDLDRSTGTDQKPRFTLRPQRKVAKLSEEHMEEGRNIKQDYVYYKDDTNESAKLLLRGNTAGSFVSSSPYKLLPPIGQPQPVSNQIILKLIIPTN